MIIVALSVLALSGCGTDPVGLQPQAQSGFTIELRFIDQTLSPSQQMLVAQAASRWGSLITGDLPDVYLTRASVSCIKTVPPIEQWVDDLLIDVGSLPIDGSAETLAVAGPCILRGESALPVYGAILFDQGDLQALEDQTYLETVVLHEIAHVLGFGLLWPLQNLIGQANSADPVYLGVQGTAQYIDLGGQGLVPIESFESIESIESGGIESSRNVHWRELFLGNELMTGSLNIEGSNPLSRITLGAMMDLGYQFQDPWADPYVLPGEGGSVQLVQPDALEGWERILTTSWEGVDSHGRILWVTGE